MRMPGHVPHACMWHFILLKMVGTHGVSPEASFLSMGVGACLHSYVGEQRSDGECVRTCLL